MAKGILDIKKGFIMHQVNCKGVMGAGLALAIKKEYPHVFKEYKELCKKNFNLGTYQVINVADGLSVVNAFGQDNYGRDKQQTDYDAWKKIVESLNADFGNNPVIYIPEKIGCGLAGGDWETMKQILSDLQCEVNIVDKKGAITNLKNKNNGGKVMTVKAGELMNFVKGATVEEIVELMRSGQLKNIDASEKVMVSITPDTKAKWIKALDLMETKTEEKKEEAKEVVEKKQVTKKEGRGTKKKTVEAVETTEETVAEEKVSKELTAVIAQLNAYRNGKVNNSMNPGLFLYKLGNKHFNLEDLFKAADKPFSKESVVVMASACGLELNNPEFKELKANNKKAIEKLQGKESLQRAVNKNAAIIAEHGTLPQFPTKADKAIEAGKKIVQEQKEKTESGEAKAYEAANPQLKESFFDKYKSAPVKTFEVKAASAKGFKLVITGNDIKVEAEEVTGFDYKETLHEGFVMPVSETPVVTEEVKAEPVVVAEEQIVEAEEVQEVVEPKAEEVKTVESSDEDSQDYDALAESAANIDFSAC